METLLDCCPINPGQHTGNVRRTFEKALDFLATPLNDYGPVIDWHYLRDGKPCKPKDVSAMQLSHVDWVGLMVEFALKPPYAETEYADRNDLDTAYRRFLDNENAKQEDEFKVMQKKRTDPKLHTPNAYMQHCMGVASGNMSELMSRRFESLICEQIWLVRKAPPRFIGNLREGDHYLVLEDLKFPMSLSLALRKRLSLKGCIEKPIRKLIPDDLVDEERALFVFQWSGSLSPYAQIGIFKSPEDELQRYTGKTLIKRDYEGSVYYMGKFFDLLTAMFNAGILSPWEEENDRAD